MVRGFFVGGALDEAVVLIVGFGDSVLFSGLSSVLRLSIAVLGFMTMTIPLGDSCWHFRHCKIKAFSQMIVTGINFTYRTIQYHSVRILTTTSLFEFRIPLYQNFSSRFFMNSETVIQ